MLKKITFKNSPPYGIQKEYAFENGYGASVICHEGSYGHEVGLWELAVLWQGDLCYDTPIANDVIGDLTEAEVNDHLERIEAL